MFLRKHGIMHHSKLIIIFPPIHLSTNIISSSQRYMNIKVWIRDMMYNHFFGINKKFSLFAKRKFSGSPKPCDIHRYLCHILPSTYILLNIADDFLHSVHGHYSHYHEWNSKSCTTSTLSLQLSWMKQSYGLWPHL